MNYNLTINVYDSFTNAAVEDAIYEVAYVESGTSHVITPTAPGVYSCPEGTTIYMQFTKNGYATSYENRVLSADTTVDKYLAPNSYKCVFPLNRTLETSVRDLYASGTVTLQHKNNDTWETIESCVLSNAVKPYFGTALTSGEEYRVNLENITYGSRQGTIFDIPNYEWTATSENDGYPSRNVGLYTWEKTRTAFRPIFKDSKTGSVITPSNVLYYGIDMGDEIVYDLSNKNTYIDAFLVTHNSVADIHIKPVAELTGYETYETPFNWGPGTQQKMTHEFDVLMDRSKAFTITVTDVDTGAAISGFEATVSKDGAVIETSTDGDFYEPWDGTSTYTLTVTAPGYVTYTADLTAYPSSVQMTEDLQYSKLYVNVTDRGTAVQDATVTVTEVGGDTVPLTDGYYSLVYNKDKTYELSVSKTDYTPHTEIITPTSSDVTKNIAIQKIFRYTTLTVSATDSRHGTAISDAIISVIDTATGDIITPTAGVYTLICNDNKTYTVTISKIGYSTYTENITPSTETPLTLNVQLSKILKYAKLYVSVKDQKGTVLSDAAVSVYDEFTSSLVEKTGEYWELICNDDVPYHIEVSCDKYYSYTGNTFVPSTTDDIQENITLEKIPVYAPLYVTVTSQKTGELIDADIYVYDDTTESYIDPTGIFWKLLAEEAHEYHVEVRKDGYYDYDSETFTADSADPIYKSYAIELEPVYALLTVTVKDAETGEYVVDPIVTVMCETTGEEVEVGTDGKYHLLVDDLYYKVYVSKRGYASDESELLYPTDSTGISEVFALEPKYEPFAETEDLKNRTGIAYTAEQIERIGYLLEDVSNLIRSEGRKCDVDVDAKIATDRIFRSTVKTVTCDVVQRILRQSQEGDPMSQESQSALGYSWSGSYAIPGGGIAMSLMRNEKDILGFNAQTIGVIELC